MRWRWRVPKTVTETLPLRLSFLCVLLDVTVAKYPLVRSKKEGGGKKTKGAKEEAGKSKYGEALTQYSGFLALVLDIIFVFLTTKGVFDCLGAFLF